MDKIEIIQYLLDEVKEEQAYAKEYEQVRDDYRKTSTPQQSNWGHKLFKMRTPNKSRIHDNLKMIRRLTLEIEKGGIFNG